MPTRPSRRAEGEIDDNVVFVLGAGVDRVFGLPLLNTLFHDLGEFARGAGKGINSAIRKHAKPLPLDLQTYGGDQAENLGQKLLGSDPDLLPRIIAALDKHRDTANPRVSTVRTLMKKLSVIANENELNEAIMSELSRTDDRSRLEEALWAREGVYSTGLGFGFATPHCKTPAVVFSSIGILKLRRPVDWSALDSEPVKMVILIAMRQSEVAGAHLQVFSKLARKLMNEDFRQYLLGVESAEEMVEYLTKELGIADL